jgi:adenosylcobyric acid synthase
VLLKPEADTRSQVVINGVVRRELTESPWRGRATRLWPHVEAAYRSLAADYDVVVIEGAGSPAETNLWADDIVNMRVAELAGTPVLLVADIDRGGAFAHLYGT